MNPMKRLPDECHALVAPGKFDECWHNNKYEVLVRRIHGNPPAGWPPITWLSIKRRGDKAAVRDWRHLQEIKNDICGEEAEGVELYPAESRKMDEANQFHMYVIQSRWPFGHMFRTVEQVGKNGAVQRPFTHSDRFGPDFKAKETGKEK